MKKSVSIFALSFVAFATVGCVHVPAQVPTPSQAPTVGLLCTASPSCTSGMPACTYQFARAVCPTATSCPANTAGNTSFQILNSTPVASCAYTDTAPPGNSLVIYTVSTIQAYSPPQTSQPSAPSNNGVPLSIPASTSAPGAPAATETAALAPPVVPSVSPAPVLAKNAAAGPLILTAALAKK
jgi:hypothetical protein